MYSEYNFFLETQGIVISQQLKPRPIWVQQRSNTKQLKYKFISTLSGNNLEKLQLTESSIKKVQRKKINKMFLIVRYIKKGYILSAYND